MEEHTPWVFSWQHRPAFTSPQLHSRLWSWPGLLELPGSFHDVATASSGHSPAGFAACSTPPSVSPAPGRDIEPGVSDGIFGPGEKIYFENISNCGKYFSLPRSQVCPSVPSEVSDSRQRPFL